MEHASADTVRAVIAQVKAELAMVADLIVHPATDPLAWLDSARQKVDELEAALVGQQERCLYCSFDPTSMNDYCDTHRPRGK